LLEIAELDVVLLSKSRLINQLLFRVLSVEIQTRGLCARGLPLFQQRYSLRNFTWKCAAWWFRQRVSSFYKIVEI
jgi:hypothetical protein